VQTGRTACNDERHFARLREPVPIKSDRAGEHEQRRRSAATLPDCNVAHVAELLAPELIRDAVIVGRKQACLRRHVEWPQKAERHSLHAVKCERPGSRELTGERRII
jgi:hypothetical protein